jgi:type II secretory pathway pseudopilin PulG
MSIWLWVVLGSAAFAVLSLAVSLVLASLLGRIARQEEAELLETELWSLASLARERRQEEPVPSVTEAEAEPTEQLTATRPSSPR